MQQSHHLHAVRHTLSPLQEASTDSEMTDWKKRADVDVLREVDYALLYREALLICNSLQLCLAWHVSICHLLLHL